MERPSARIGYRLCVLRGAFGIDIRHGHHGALGGQQAGSFSANPGGASRDQRHLSTHIIGAVRHAASPMSYLCTRKGWLCSTANVQVALTAAVDYASSSS